MGKIKRDFVSDIDVALNTFNTENELSESQEREINKHKDIFNKRTQEDGHEDLWR